MSESSSSGSGVEVGQVAQAEALLRAGRPGAVPEINEIAVRIARQRLEGTYGLRGRSTVLHAVMAVFFAFAAVQRSGGWTMWVYALLCATGVFFLCARGYFEWNRRKARIFLARSSGPPGG